MLFDQDEREKRDDMAGEENQLLTDITDNTALQNRIDAWIDPVGAWSDLPGTFLEDLDRLRHAVPPTPPIQAL